MIPLVLASASPARLSTLRAAGIDPVVRVSGVDEDAFLDGLADGTGAADAVLALARAKAECVAASSPDVPGGAGLVLGCDSMLELDGRALGKPTGPDDAVARWRAMRGRRGVLHTGHWLVDLRGHRTERGATSSTVVRFADLADDEIDAYVATGEPLAVAGAFTVDGLGGPFVTAIEGDHHGVVGLSLPLLRDLLAQVGLRVMDLWRPALRDTGVEPLPVVVTRTERLVLRRLTADDAPALAAYRSAPEVARYQSWDAPYGVDRAAELVAGMTGTRFGEPGEWLQVGVEAGGRLVGDVAVHVDGDDPRQARLGVTLAPDAQGHGFATEAVRAVIDLLVREHGVHRVSADCDARNTASARLLERVGMRREAHHVRAAWWKGEWTDELVYAVLAEQWLADDA